MLPIIPGTFGALAGVLVHIIIWFFSTKWYYECLVLSLLLVSLANHLLTPWAIKFWKCNDPKQFVLDEIAGYLLVPILFRGSDILGTILWSFFLFRLFDIVKVPPARQIDRKMHNAWGIILDDLVSAVYASATLYFLRYFSLSKGFNIGL